MSGTELPGVPHADQPVDPRGAAESKKDDGPTSGPSHEPRYTVISADTHAAPAVERYRSYLDPAFRTDFDMWFFGRARDETEEDQTWEPDPDEGRLRIQEADGVVAEVVHSDGRLPFCDDIVVVTAPPHPAEYRLRQAGVQAHNRWLADYCAAFPARRAGIGSILLNDLDDTIREVEWIAAHGLRGGVQLPNITPDVDWIPPLTDRRYDRLWAVCQDLGVVVNLHLETSLPRMGHDAVDLAVFLGEAPHYAARPLVHLVLSGVFDRFPGLQVVMAEQPIGVLAGLLEYLDPMYALMRRTGSYGKVMLPDDLVLTRPPSDYLHTNVWYTASPPLVSELPVIERTVGFDHLMIGNDYPHGEGTAPHTVAILRQLFHDWTPAAVRGVLSETAAAIYGFDLAALAPLAATCGPTEREIATSLGTLPDDGHYVLVANALAGEANPSQTTRNPDDRPGTDSVAADGRCTPG